MKADAKSDFARMMFSSLVARLASIAVIVTEIEAVVLHRVPYDSWQGAAGMVLGAITWWLADFCFAACKL
jgi:hypothetical protein